MGASLGRRGRHGSRLACDAELLAARNIYFRRHSQKLDPRGGVAVGLARVIEQGSGRIAPVPEELRPPNACCKAVGIVDEAAETVGVDACEASEHRS